MFINKSSSGKNNICGETIARLRKQRKLSQRELADALQLAGLDIDKNAIQRIEGMAAELFAGPGAVRKTLHKYVSAR